MGAMRSESSALDDGRCSQTGFEVSGGGGGVGKGFMLFGVRLMTEGSFWKSVSMNNLAQYDQLPQDSSHDIAVSYASDDVVHPSSRSREQKRGPKEWLKEQKKKSSKFLLAPVDASRNILQSAYLLLMKSEAEFGESELDEVQNLLVSAARDCVPQDRNSFVEFQASTGVEVCTFKLIVKNASSLLGDRDPLKLEAESKLNDLIRSFSSLSGMAREGSVQLTLNSKQRVVDALKDTISSLNNFEQGIKDCLQV